METLKKPVWEEAFPVRFADVDRSDKLKLSAVFQFFQEAAISHAEHLGVGKADMAKNGRVWMLSRMSVQVDSRPSYCENVTVRSWPRGSAKLFALRDYDIQSGGVPKVRARSGWLVIDLKTRRPLRAQTVMDSLPLNEGMDALHGVPQGVDLNFAPQTAWRKTGERKAAYTDVDYNGHVNNVRHVQWIEDAVGEAAGPLLEKAARMRLHLNYLDEVLSGATTEIWALAHEAADAMGVFSFEGKNKESGKSVFKAELTLWE